MLRRKRPIADAMDGVLEAVRLPAHALTGALLLMMVLLGSCAAPTWPAPPALPSTAFAEEGLRTRLQQAREAHAALLEQPQDEARIVWYGRRLAYLGHYREAIAVYTRGLALYPNSTRLLRHRGHRWITVRRFTAAIQDLERAAALIQGQPDQIEQDGIPNARNQPTSTLHTNVWYHLGLAYYCQGDLQSALHCYQSCLAAARNRDMEAAARYWLFLSATHLGDPLAAQAALEPVRADWDIIENHAYHRLLLLYRGELDPASLPAAGGDAVQDATLQYGLARFLLLARRVEEGRSLLQSTAALRSPAFGCIAAEADLRLGR